MSDCVRIVHPNRLARRVAIKVLRPDRRRHRRRALPGRDTTTANLHHPYILARYDSGDSAGLLSYVMPFVEGESRRERISREKER